MRAFDPPIVHELVVDGLALNTYKPFSVYESFPRNDSIKSTTSTFVGSKEDYQLPEVQHDLQLISKSLNETTNNNYQETYEIMLRIRSISELQVGQQQLLNQPVSNQTTPFCPKRKLECVKHKKTLYLNEFSSFQFKTTQ